MGNDDSVKLSYTYYHENINGMLTPVDVYGVVDRNYINEFLAGKFLEEQVLSMDQSVKADNVYSWCIENPLYGELIVVPKGTSVDDIRKAIEDNRVEEILLKEGSVIMCVDITSYKSGTAYLSYINEKNAAKGYCNMWLREGGTSAYPYGAVLKMALGEHTYYEYEISGTH